MAILYIVVPCYNEEEVIAETASRLTAKLTSLIKSGRCSEESRILFVDDCSKDSTWEKIGELYVNNELVEGLKLSHNRGHQNALLAGLLTAKERSDCVVSMDADLQDDIEVLDQFLDEFHKGNEIVFGVRSKRDTDSFFKKFTAICFYKLMKLLGASLVYNHADYRLMSKKAIEALAEYKEVNLFLRGIIPLIGYRCATVYYDRSKRFAGTSKYPLKKMISFALDGITSFTVKPLKLISNVGIIISLCSVLGLLYALLSKLYFGAEPGWTAIVASIWLLGGIQLFCLGIIGEYIGKIYTEVKARPKYLIEEFLKR